MAWIFLPGGLLMPSAVPMDLADEKFTLGKRDLQVRARVESHLENFINEYMEPLGLDYSEIEATPGMDYNFRFYTTRPEFAAAMAKAIEDIDYEKFKPTAETEVTDGDAQWRPYQRQNPVTKKWETPPEADWDVGNTSTGRWERKLKYPDGKDYHDVLNSIWGVVCRLGSPGGWWGAKSATNTRGYSTVAEYAERYPSAGGASYIDSLDDDGNYLGSTFLPSSRESGRKRDLKWWEDDGYGDDSARNEDDYVPEREEILNDIKDRMKGVPVEQWDEYLDDWEMRIAAEFIVTTLLERDVEVEARRSARRTRRTTKNTKKSGYKNSSGTKRK